MDKRIKAKLGEDDPHYVRVNLAQAVEARNANLPIVFTGTVGATDDAPFILPRLIRMACRPSQEENAPCANCLWKQSAHVAVDLANHPEVALAIALGGGFGKAKVHQQKVMDQHLGIPKACPSHFYCEDEMGNLLYVRVHPPIGEEEVKLDQEHYRENVAYVWEHQVEHQETYDWYGYTIQSPEDNRAVHVIRHAERMEESWRSFRLSPDLAQKMTIFQCKGSEEPFRVEDGDLSGKLSEIHKAFEQVHHIYGRTLQSIGMGLSWFSPLWFRFGGEEIRGWMNVLAFGDTGQGKTQIVNHFVRHFGAGEKFSGPSSTAAGLLAGTEKIHGRWITKGGLYPRCHGGLVIGEEVHGMPRDLWLNLLECMAEGMVRTDKVARYRSRAHVRMLILSNCLGANGKTVSMDAAPFPVQHVNQIMRRQEAVRRLDYVVPFMKTKWHDQTMYAGIESRNGQECLYTAELCQALVRWVWSRKEEEVTFTEGAEKAIVEGAQMFGENYSSSVPICQSADVRHKIARLAASIAGHVFSTDDAVHLRVEEAHAYAAMGLLDAIYNSPELEYHDYSQHVRRYERSLHEGLAGLALNLSSVVRHDESGKPAAKAYLPAMLYAIHNYTALGWQDVQTNCGLTEFEAKRFMEILESNGMLQKNPNGNVHSLTGRGSQALKTLERWCRKSERPIEEFRPEDVA